MHQPRLHSSQELTLHQINVEQSYQSRDADGLLFPSSPSSPYAQASGNFVVRGGGLNSPLFVSRPPSGAPSPSYAPCVTPPHVQTPGGSSSTATASIVRPEVRLRPEWTAALDDVETFGLPGDGFLRSADETAPTPVRYIADDYDRQWLAQRLGEYGSDFTGGAGLGRGGKTGMARLPSQSGANSHRGGANVVGSDIGISLLEDIITAFELCAHFNPEIPLERLNNVEGLYLGDVSASAAIIADVRHYWLGKREALGGHIPCIPALSVAVREDNQNTLCHPDVLGDCPLPFKWRDWTVSVVSRKHNRADEDGDDDGDGDGTDNCGDSREKARCTRPRCEEHVAFAKVALALSAEMLQRERLRCDHTQLVLYELACLRGLGDHVVPLPSAETRPVLTSDDGPFVHAGDLVPVGVQLTLSAVVADHHRYPTTPMR